MTDIKYRDIESLKSKLRQLTQGFKYTINTSLLDNGNTCRESQRICLLNALNVLEAQIEGLVEEDRK